MSISYTWNSYRNSFRVVPSSAFFRNKDTSVVVWHPTGVNDRKPHYPTLPEIEDMLYDAALLLAAWEYVKTLLWG